MNCYFNERRFFLEEKTQKISSRLFGIKTPYNIDPITLELYLCLGYVPGDLTLFKDIKLINSKDKRKNLLDVFSSLPEYSHDLNTLKNLMLNSIAERYESNATHVVPLSGGMDSRIILAALCEFTEAKNIHTYTFGVPSAYDYEIPNSVAKKLGTKHTNFNAKDTLYTVDGLIRAAVASDGNTEIFHPLVLNRVADYYGSNVTFWSGFAGDLVGGAFGDKLSGENPKQQLINYEKRGIHFLDSVVKDEAVYPYIANGDKMNGYVPSSEACFWENHVERYTGHHIFRNDMRIEAPLVDTHLLKFFFTVPKNERMNKKFFNESFASIFPEVFNFPTTDYGYKYSKYSFLEPLRKARFYSKAIGWRFAPSLFTHANAAYIDMQHAINERPDVRGCIDELLADLAQRNLVDNKRMFSFLSDHRNGRNNYTKDIINLASLEVILKAANL